MSPRRIAVCFEVTPKQTFASALDWPGWCRAGRDEGAALEALASYAERYTPVAEQAGLSVPSTVAFDVVERVPGGPATAFAAPECRRPFPQVTAGGRAGEGDPGLAGEHDELDRGRAGGDTRGGRRVLGGRGPGDDRDGHGDCHPARVVRVLHRRVGGDDAAGHGPGSAQARSGRRRARAVPAFAGSYLAVWALAGVAVYAPYRPHGTLAAGTVTVAAGVYEVTPLKRHFRRRCRENIGSGLGFGLCCPGSRPKTGLGRWRSCLAAARWLIGSFNHGSMANALPHAIGAQASHPGSQVIALSGDGGLAMLLGELITLRQMHLPVKVVVFNNGALSFVELEMKAAGIVTYGTDLDNPDFAGIARARRAVRRASGQGRSAGRRAAGGVRARRPGTGRGGHRPARAVAAAHAHLRRDQGLHPLRDPDHPVRRRRRAARARPNQPARTRHRIKGAVSRY